MGLLDGKILTTYVADTSQQVRELEKLKGAERERAQAAIDGLKKEQAGYESHIKTLGTAREALGTLTSAYRAASDAMAAWSDRARLIAAAGDVDLGKLQKASAGLKKETELLSDAARLQHGQFKLTSDQMAIAEQAMLSLTRQSHDQAKSSEAVLHAITALKTDGLDELGVHIDKAGLSMDVAADRTELLRRTFVALQAASKSAGEQALTDAEMQARAAVKTADFWEKAYAKIGGAAHGAGRLVALAGLATGFKPIEAQRGYANEADMGPGIGGMESGQWLNWISSTRAARSNAIANSGPWSNVPVGESSTLDPALGAFQRANSFLEAHGGSNLISAPLTEDQVNALASSKARALIAANIRLSFRGTEIGNLTGSPTDYGRFTGRGPGSGADLGELGQNAGIFGNDFTESLGKIANDKLTGNWNDRIANLQSQDATRKNRLESMFGPLSEFNAYKQAFDALGGAVSSSMKAWIEGSTSAGKAFKAFIAQAVESIAVQMAMESLKHGAFALGSLAFGDIRGAGQHGAAAAAFAAGAVAAAAAARAMGHGGADYGKGSGTGKGAGNSAPVGGAGGGYSQQSSVVYVVGDPFGDQTPRERAANFKRQAQAALGSAATREG